MNLRQIHICLGITLWVFGMMLSLPASSGESTAYQAVVSRQEAVFTFPINPQKQYEWCPGGLNYTWNIKTTNGKKKFEFGFWLFTAMGASLCEKGGFRALLEAGQFDVSEVIKGSSSTIPNIEVKHTVSNNGKELGIVLIGKQAIDLLFSSKPKYVVFQSQVLDRKSSKKIPVKYSD